MFRPSVTDTHLSPLHRFLWRTHFYPLALSTALGFAIVAYRFGLSGQLGFRFLVWNLFLAWIPYWAAQLMLVVDARRPKRPVRGIVLLVLGIVWLIFFPNAPYIATDLIHLRPRPAVPHWYDLGLIITFVWTGAMLALVSLGIVHDLLERWLGRAMGWAVVLVVILLCGLGIYLGRFLRWNSWDLLRRPGRILSDLAARLADPLGNLRTYGVTLLFAAILLVCYLTYLSIRGRRSTDPG